MSLRAPTPEQLAEFSARLHELTESLKLGLAQAYLKDTKRSMPQVRRWKLLEDANGKVELVPAPLNPTVIYGERDDLR